ncbi:hypothetical protein T265_10744 [Opisthorchis viverrini]|uniref:Uncharacterized protein n=1 Tax=Opisthorchis viverrini TaxID=6198 RepID=A0A074Z163_OPIVI|nr:hypothetical protein T265_10744 [Opisthorchis viverrini]KER20786.1 hypothetical protein T265_10744 [Opisthorchis viverrini]
MNEILRRKMNYPLDLVFRYRLEKFGRFLYANFIRRGGKDAAVIMPRLKIPGFPSSGYVQVAESLNRKMLLHCTTNVKKADDSGTNRVGPTQACTTMSPRLVMKRLQSNCQARRTGHQPNRAPELPTFHNIARSDLVRTSPIGCIFAQPLFCRAASICITDMKLATKFVRELNVWMTCPLECRIPCATSGYLCHAKPNVLLVSIEERLVDWRSRKRVMLQRSSMVPPRKIKPIVKYNGDAYPDNLGGQPAKQSLCSRMLNLTRHNPPYPLVCPNKDVHVNRYRPLIVAQHELHTDSDRLYDSLKTSAR